MQQERKKRTYTSPDRVHGARATARAILAAAEVLFVREGYASVTMKQIASEAGVAPATVYLHFNGKGAIVRALAEAITDAPDLSVTRVEGEGSVEGQLRTAVSILQHLNERSWAVVEILRSHSGAEPEMNVLAQEWQQRHFDAVRRGVGAVANAGRLRPGVTVEQAADILYAIAGTDVYRSLVRERGWTAAEYGSWLTQFIESQLLSEPPSSSPHTSVTTSSGSALGSS
ncbi:hypothetical protein AYO38_03480 [bacterium SCGC AG-212-C10]|nr:hypothetical protein AYO38_03480 [bacterium SCGC AG-212-C10]